MVWDGPYIFTVGEENFFESGSLDENSKIVVVFEDDTNTGYVYLYAAEEILDALHIYNVTDVSDKGKPSELKFFWSKNGNVVFVNINDYTHAIFDFQNRKSYCRNGFPPTKADWSQNEDRLLTDEMVNEIYQENKN